MIQYISKENFEQIWKALSMKFNQKLNIYDDLTIEELNKILEEDCQKIYDIYNFVPELNTGYIKCWNFTHKQFVYYTVDKYVEELDEVPIGISIKPQESQEGYTIALKYGNTNTPDIGSNTEQYMAWGNNGILIEGIQCADTSAEVIADFNGRHNTELMLELCTGQPNWRTDPKIEANGGKGYAPAAQTCWRYHTPGTNQGDWYLPAGGEMYVTMGKYWTQLRPCFEKVNSSVTRTYIHVSTQKDASSAWHTSGGTPRTAYGKQTSSYTLPFSYF